MQTVHKTLVALTLAEQVAAASHSNVDGLASLLRRRRDGAKAAPLAATDDAAINGAAREKVDGDISDGAETKRIKAAAQKTSRAEQQKLKAKQKFIAQGTCTHIVI